MEVIRIEMDRDQSQDSVWDQPYKQHENFQRDAVMAVFLLAGIVGMLLVLA